MPFVDLQSEVKQGTLCWADRWNIVLRIMCPDRVPEGGEAPMLISIEWSPPRADGETILTFIQRSETGGKISFDSAGDHLEKTITGDFGELVTVYGKDPTTASASEPDVSLEIKINDKVRGTFPMSVGPVTTTIEIKAENGIDDPPEYVLTDYPVGYKAVASEGPGSFRWISSDVSALVITQGESEEIVETEARGAVATSRKLCVLYDPDSGPAVMAVHDVQVWPVADLSTPGAYRVGQLHYGDNDRIQVTGSSAGYLSRWGSSGNGDGEFNHPGSVAVDGVGVVYVVDKDNNRIQKFSPDGIFIAQWGGSGSDSGEFNRPWGIAIDTGNSIYVADTGNNRIQKFNRNGGFLSKWGSAGSGDGEFDEPFGIAVDNAGHCYVSDRNNHRVQKFTDTGTFVAKWGSSGTADGGFNHPAGIAVDDTYRVYVADEDNHRVQKFTSSGSFMTKWGKAGAGDGEFDHPVDITADTLGSVYVTDRDNSRVQRFSGTGIFQAVWGTAGAGDGEFNSPSGIVISKSNTLYVTDFDNHRVQLFSFIRRWGRTGSLDGEFMGPAGLAITAGGELLVADRYNNRVQRFNSTTGAFVSKWGGRGTGDGEFDHPFGIAIDGGNNIYVTDRDNHRVQKFDSTGAYLTQWGSQGGADGQFRKPTGMVFHGGHIYVADQENHRIQKFTTPGAFVHKWGKTGNLAGTGDGEFNAPIGIAVDSGGHLYVADRDNNRIQKFTSAGVFVTKWGSDGSGDGEFNQPAAVAVDAGDHVHVADLDNDRVQKFNNTGTFFETWGVAGDRVGELRCPSGLAIDPAGNLFVADTGPTVTIGGGLEGVAEEVVVNLEALVRYPADSNGVGVQLSTREDEYPLVILAHGRHSPFEFHRTVAGAIVMIGAGIPDTIVDAGGNVMEFKNYEGLEYIASHLASHGFIAVSVNLNGRYHPDTDLSEVWAELVKPQQRLLSCRPAESDQAAIAHRGLTILRHIMEMKRRSEEDALFYRTIDLSNTVLLGHSRGGEAVVSAYELNKILPPANQAQIKGVISIAPTDFRHISLDVPFLAINGSDDGDVIDAGGLRIYDRADPPRQLVWVIGAIHNYFSSNWQWQGEVPAAPLVDRDGHENIAKAYANLFVHQYIIKNVAGLATYFTGERSISALAAIDRHHSYQTVGGLMVDSFEDAPADKTRNTLSGAVTDVSVKSFDEMVFHRHTAAVQLPGPPTAGMIADMQADPPRLTPSRCTIHLAYWFHETNAMMIEWDTDTAVYNTALPNVSVVDFKAMSFRVAQDKTVNPVGGTQDFKVKLSDSAGQEAFIKVSDITTIPYPREKEVDIGITVDFSKSVFKTVRIPLKRFTQLNNSLDLTSLAAIAFMFSETTVGRLGIDDIEFTQ